MQQEITVRETSHDYECQDCFGYEVDVHGRCASCGSEAVALILHDIHHVYRPARELLRQSLPSGQYLPLSGKSSRIAIR